MKPTWVVIDEELFRNSEKYNDVGLASKVAENLATNNPNDRYYVLRITGSCKSSRVTWDIPEEK